MADKPRIKPYLGMFYSTLAVVLVLTAGRAAFSALTSGSNPDSSDPEQMTRDYYEYRHKYIKAAKPTERNIENTAHAALCGLNRMGHPIGDDYEPTEADKFPKAVKVEREAGKFFWDFSKAGNATAEERSKRATKYIWMGNVHNYNREHRINDAISTVDRYKHDDKIKGFVEWLTIDGETLLKEPLYPVHNYDGSVMEDFQGNPCLFLRPLAEAITTINRSFYINEKQNFKPIACYRSNLHQAVAFAGTHGCKLENQKDGLMRCGNSHHGMGLAFDLANQDAAEPYLAMIGVACGFIGGDEGHCSFGESSMTSFLYKAMARAMMKRAEIVLEKGGKYGKKVWRELTR